MFRLEVGQQWLPFGTRVFEAISLSHILLARHPLESEIGLLAIGDAATEVADAAGQHGVENGRRNA
jgi:hypothetical protein